MFACSTIVEAKIWKTYVENLITENETQRDL